MKAIVAELPDPQTSSKPDLLLVALSKKFPEAGRELALDWNIDYPLACARPGGEIKFYLRALRERGYVSSEGGTSITLSGWERVEQLVHNPIESKTVFVAMRFSEEMLIAYKDAFAPAIEKAGFHPILANEPQHNDKIDAKIMTEIKQARFVVADSTGRNAGVYFEAGYALGLGRPVIWTCRSDSEGDMHFDTRQYNHILWETKEKLLDLLYYRIMATI